MIHILIGKGGSGKTWYLQHELLKQADSPLVYYGLISVAASWEGFTSATLLPIPKVETELSFSEVMAFELNDHYVYFKYHVEQLIELSKKADVFLCIHKYDSIFEPLFELTSAITYFAMSPGPMLDTPRKYLPKPDKIREIYNFNECFDEHRYYTLILQEVQNESV